MKRVTVKDFQFYGNIEDYVVFSFTSIENEGSSLIYMVKDFDKSKHVESGFTCTIIRIGYRLTP
jgi:hypothetical protein